jgi:hypothetical protein
LQISPCQLDWELGRFAELQRIQAQKGFMGLQVDTSHMSTTEVAERIWQKIWISQG